MIFLQGNFCSVPLASCIEPFHVVKTQLNKSKSRVVSNLSSSHPNEQPGLLYPLQSLCCRAELCCTIHCAVYNRTIFFSFSFSPINITDIYFSLRWCWQKKYYPSLCPFNNLVFPFPMPSLARTDTYTNSLSGFFSILLSLCILNY